jgi:hypothetical protein
MIFKPSFRPQVWLAAVLGGLVSAAMLLKLNGVGTAVALQPNLQQVEPFLSVPYYGTRRLTSYVDHDPIGDIAPNKRIEIYRGETASLANGWCDDANATEHIAFCTEYSDTPPACNGECLWYDAHSGTDFSMRYEPVLAAANGMVVFANWDNDDIREEGYGLHVRISHDNGYETRYAHLSAITVQSGEQVQRGQIIGTSGDTGNVSGPHLHFEVRLNDTFTDPFGGTDAEWLWSDGKWIREWPDPVWKGKSTPIYTPTHIVDDDNPQQVGDADDDPNFTKGYVDQTGQFVNCPPGNDCSGWYRETTGYDGDMWWTSVFTNNHSHWAYWQPPKAGIYDVQAFIPSVNATTWGATYCLVSSEGQADRCNILVDQQGASNEWLSLGTYRFGEAPASWAGIRLYNNDPTEPDDLSNRDQVGVDAVRFRRPWTVYLPLLLKQATFTTDDCYVGRVRGIII